MENLKAMEIKEKGGFRSRGHSRHRIHLNLSLTAPIGMSCTLCALEKKKSYQKGYIGSVLLIVGNQTNNYIISG